MAHSIQEYGGRSEIMNDLDIAMIGTVIINIVEQSKRKDFSPMIEFWKSCFDAYGPGTIDLHISDFITNETMREKLSSLLEQAAEIISAHPVFSMSDINKISYQPKFASFKNYPTAVLLQAVDQLKHLIAIQPTTNNHPQANQSTSNALIPEQAK